MKRPRLLWELKLPDGHAVSATLPPLADRAAVVWHRDGLLEGAQECGSVEEARLVSERRRRALSETMKKGGIERF